MNYAKLLLFGEYTVLYGGDCVELPYKKYGGVLTLEEAVEGEEELARWSNRQLQEFYHHLLKTINTGTYSHFFNNEQMATDMSRGLWFKSNIPGQSGFGSSGALVAAFVKRYGVNIQTENLEGLKVLFAALESNFHGKSSGMDPLVSFLGAPVVEINNKLQTPNLQYQFSEDVKLFLVHAMHEKKTKILINTFKSRMEDNGFKSAYLNELLPETNGIVSQILGSTDSSWFNRLKTLSRLQKQFYTDIIPEKVLRLMDSELFHLKLLGSGGGYMLGFTKDYKETANFFNALGITLTRIKYSDLILE